MAFWFRRSWEAISEPKHTEEEINNKINDIISGISQEPPPRQSRRLKSWIKDMMKYGAAFGMVAALLSGMKAGYDYWIAIEQRGEETHREQKIKASRRTITDLYHSWENKDIKKYSDCWDPSAVQLSDNYTRNYTQIINKRSVDFDRFKRVIVKYLKFESIEPVEETLIEVYCMYSMHFETKDGLKFNEVDIKERFFLEYDDKTEKAKIVRNDTYINAPVGEKLVLGSPAPAPNVNSATSAEMSVIGPPAVDKKWVDLPAPKR